jgi:plasmid stability protein
MADLLVRDVPDGVMAAIDVRARRLGLPHTAYVRHALVREAVVSNGEVVMEDLVWFADMFADLADGDVMRHAWK